MDSMVVAHSRPGVICKGKKIGLAELSQYFSMPIKDVAKTLGVCTTTLKKVCRKNGIPRWPHRQIKCIERTINRLERLTFPNPEMLDKDRVSKEITALQQKKLFLLRNPTAFLEQEMHQALGSRVAMTQPLQGSGSNIVPSTSALANDGQTVVARSVPTVYPRAPVLRASANVQPLAQGRHSTFSPTYKSSTLYPSPSSSRPAVGGAPSRQHVDQFTHTDVTQDFPHAPAAPMPLSMSTRNCASALLSVARDTRAASSSHSSSPFSSLVRASHTNTTFTPAESTTSTPPSVESTPPPCLPATTPQFEQETAATKRSSSPSQFITKSLPPLPSPGGQSTASGPTTTTVSPASPPKHQQQPPRTTTAPNFVKLPPLNFGTLPAKANHSTDFVRLPSLPVMEPRFHLYNQVN